MRTNNKYSNYSNKCIGIWLIFLSAIPFITMAQDPHFSQYYTSPMTMNPALIGKDVEDGRVMANFRSQWWGSTGLQPYNTETVSFEKRLATEKLNNNNNLSFGLMMLTDQSNGGLLQNNYFSGGFSYSQALDGQGNQLLGAGLSVTYANRILNPSMFEFQSQFGSMGFQRNIPSNDPVSLQKNKYWDVNVGVHYSSRVNNAVGWNIGAGMFHLTRPTEGVYSSNQYQIDTRLNIQAGVQLYFSDKSQLHLSSIYESQYSNSIYTLGAVYKVKVEDENLESINLGLWNRIGDAVYPYLALETKKWLLAMSYDVVTSSVKTIYNSVSSIEFSVAWKITGKKTPTSSAKYDIINY